MVDWLTSSNTERESNRQFRSCVKVEVVVLGSPSLIFPTVSVDLMQHSTLVPRLQQVNGWLIDQTSTSLQACLAWIYLFPDKSVWPWLTEFSDVALNCFTPSRLTFFFARIKVFGLRWLSLVVLSWVVSVFFLFFLLFLTDKTYKIPQGSFNPLFKPNSLFSAMGPRNLWTVKIFVKIFDGVAAAVFILLYFYLNSM